MTPTLHDIPAVRAEAERHAASCCNGSGIIRDLTPGDTGDVCDCPGCVACMWDDDDTDNRVHHASGAHEGVATKEPE